MAVQKLDFRIDWGYQYLYSRRHYHPFYLWDGELKCTNGKITGSYQLDYPVIWFGPGHCAHEKKLVKPKWKISTHRGVSGVRFTAEVDKNTIFHLNTLSGCFDFSAKEILDKGRIVFPVGPKYLGCHVIVTRTNYYWFRPQPKAGQQVWEANDLALPVHDWARMRTAWLEPGKTLEFKAEIPEKKTDFAENILHIVAMAAPEYTPGSEKQIHDIFPMTLFCDGREIMHFAHYFRQHDRFMQMLEDVWVRFQAETGVHAFGIRNDNPHFCLLFSRLVLQQSTHNHLDLSLPSWALVNEPLIGRIFATRPDEIAIRWQKDAVKCQLKPGWNDFEFSLSEPGINVELKAGESTGVISAVYALKDENPQVTVGYDMTVVPHDDNGFMDWLLDYTWRTRLGNMVVFRSFMYQEPYNDEPAHAAPAALSRWGAFCRKHHITVEAATDFDDGTLVRASGKMLHSVGRHEWPGAVYAFDPKPEWESSDMKMAMEHYLKRLKIEIDRAHKVSKRAAFGDASGGHRYCYMAGVDFIRTETMVPHTQHLCSQARPAAEIFQNGEWGVHIAIQHACQPYFENHLGQYFLSLFQPWMMGASMIYEEDSLFQLFKEERQSWDDALTKGKRDMTRKFYRFVKTHPRTGKNKRNIAFLEGRYAAPFNGFICDSEQTPDYSVWGLFGNNSSEWGHRQPEKCRQLLDVLMPGASTQPLRQRFDRRRFFFSGTPYGDFDEVPVEAKADYFDQYKLMLNLGWNTMLDEDYNKLCHFVKNGGILFTGLPQFSTHVKRDFLRDMKDLALWNKGDLTELCGVKVLSPGGEYSGQWNCIQRELFPEPELSALPSNSVDEDGPCCLAEVELCNAEPVAWDAASGKPLIVRHMFGKGYVYLLTAWAYPGHERLQKVSASWIAKLAEENRGEIYVDDPSREVFWTRWEEGNDCSRLLLLNTDWTSKNEKTVQVHTSDFCFTTQVREREPLLLTLLPFAVLEPDHEIHTEILSVCENAAQLRFHGTGLKQLHIHWKKGKSETRLLDFDHTDTMLEIEFATVPDQTGIIRIPVGN